MTLEQWGTLKYFKPTENFGDPVAMSQNLLTRLDKWRDYITREVIICSGTQGSHVRDSEHYDGEAVDIIVPGMHLGDAFISAVRFGFSGVGLYPHWEYEGKIVGGLHLGVRSRQFIAFWMGVICAGRQVYVALNFDNLKKYNVI